MREFVKNLSKGLTIWLWFLIMLWVGYLAIKARQTANPWLTEGAPTGGLYVGANETLSAAKRNALVKRWTREDVATSDTADFDVECERRFKWNSTTFGNRWFYAGAINTSLSRIITYGSNCYRRIDKASKWTITSTDGYTWTMVKLQKKCQ